jgi:hypothetical protein
MAVPLGQKEKYDRDPPSAEVFQYWNLAISQGYPYTTNKPHFYNQDYRSPNNMQHAKEYVLSLDNLPPYTGSIEYVMSKSPPNIPDISTSQLTEKSVSINFNPTGTGGSPITGSHYVLKNLDTNQTIREKNLMSGQQNYFESNLDSGTNYKAYIIMKNAMGNSPENSISFKTLGSTPVVTTPVVTTPIDESPVILPDSPPDIIPISAEVQAILTKFDNNDYEYPYTDLPALINLVKNGSLSNEKFLITINQLLDQKTIIDKTTIPVEKEYDVTVLRINEFGGVYSELFYGIKGNKLLELENQFLVVLSDKPRPTDDEVRDFYNFVDTSIDTNMISQSIGAFTLKDGKVTGKIIYIAESAFNSYYYNKPVTSVVQIKDQSGSTIKLKTNNLNFTETQRDETITINEGVGDLNAVKIEFYVWKNVNEPIPFTLPKIDEIVAQEIGLDPCPIGQHRDFNNKCVPDDPQVAGTTSLLGKFMGVTALIGTLALLGSKRR